MIINNNFFTLPLYYRILVLKRKRFVTSLNVRIVLYILALGKKAHGFVPQSRGIFWESVLFFNSLYTHYMKIFRM
jgi:hypothetical protein